MLNLQTLLCRIEKGTVSNGCKYLVIAHSTLIATFLRPVTILRAFSTRLRPPFSKHPLADSTYFLSAQRAKV